MTAWIVALAIVAGFFPGVVAAAEWTLAKGGKPLVEIRVAAGATVAEQTAAAELQTYVGKIIGVAPNLVPEARESARTTGGIYVGWTAFARAHGIDLESLKAEEWIIRTEDGNLLLTGGRPRGTLYAVYHFLEDDLGVRWWSPWEETVPQQADLRLQALARRGKPVLAYRDIYMLYGNDEGAFAARNRLNREGDHRIAARYGGCRDYGPPYHVHTFYLYIKPSKYFETHPEYFSLIKGKRVAGRHQLCLSNPELRDLFVEKLRAFIRASEAKARETGAPPPVVYDISQNDWGGACQCERCQAIVKREGSEAGLLLDFINEIAARIEPEFPDVFIDTLAYQYTQDPPRHIKARDNVIIRLCDTGSNATFPITAEENAPFRHFVLAWENIAANLRIWDYAVTYQAPRGLPYPSEDTYAADFRFYAEHHVEGVFTELEFPVLADIRELKVWMMMKLLEDPYRDPVALRQEFCRGYYGAAGGAVLAYRELLRTSQAHYRAYIGMSPAPSAFKFLDLPTVLGAQRLFDAGAKAVAHDPVLSRRLRHARLSLDRATYVRLRDLAREWRASGRQGALPVDVDAIVARVRRTWTEEARARLPAARCAESLADMEAELARYTTLPVVVELPQRFRQKPAGTVFDLTADMTRNWRGIVTVVKDPEAESGIANRLAFPNKQPKEHPLEKYRLPMPWGLYVPRTKTSLASGVIRAEDVPGPGYHWYHLGTHAIPPSCYLYFFWSWIIQQDLEAVVDPDHPERRFDIWARIKFTGPAFPHGRAGEANAIWVERVVLETVDGQQP